MKVKCKSHLNPAGVLTLNKGLDMALHLVLRHAKSRCPDHPVHLRETHDYRRILDGNGRSPNRLRHRALAGKFVSMAKSDR